MRVFIASEIDENSIEIYSQAISFLKEILGRKIKPVSLTNIHLTFFFLGDLLNEEGVANIKNEFIKSFTDFRKIEFSSAKISFFPDDKKPRVLWADVDENASKRLYEIYIKIRNILNLNGIYLKEEFVPHLTLARTKGPVEGNEIDKIKNFKFKVFNGYFKNIVIFNSVLTHHGPEYKKLYQMDFI